MQYSRSQKDDLIDGSSSFAYAFLHGAADLGRTGIFEAGDGAFQLEGGSGNPQNSVTEDDPATLQGQNNGKACGIEVNFKSGTTYPNSKFPNGPGTFTHPNGSQQFGLGYTVSGWVESGGIGKIGGDSKPLKERVNPDSPKGTWTLDQETNRWTGINGKGSYKPTWSDISLGLLALQAKGNTFSYYDHPGESSVPQGFYRYQNFIVKVYNGKQVCEIAFHVVQRGGVIHWGEGNR